MTRKFIDLSIYLENDVVSDPPVYAPKIEYFDHDSTYSQMAPFFPGLAKEDLPDGATFGTSSLRRRALLGRIRPDLKIVGLRGNVGTRLSKLERGDAAATLLGLNRLFNHRLGVNQLHEIAAKLGSDIPFFLTSEAARCTGRGEKIEAIPSPSSRPVIQPFGPHCIAE